MVNKDAREQSDRPSITVTFSSGDHPSLLYISTVHMVYIVQLTHGHFVNLGTVVQLNVAKDPNIFGGDEVDGHTAHCISIQFTVAVIRLCLPLTAETTGTTNAVDVVLTIDGQVVIDDQRDLLDIDTTRPHIGRNQHTGVALTEVLHNRVTLLLGHVSVHGGDREIGFAHLLGEPVNL